VNFLHQIHLDNLLFLCKYEFFISYKNEYILFSIQDVCIVLSITLLIVMVLTTYVAQAGLLCLLLRMFRFSIVISCFYLALCAVVQALILVSFQIHIVFYLKILFISRFNVFPKVHSHKVPLENLKYWLFMLFNEHVR